MNKNTQAGRWAQHNVKRENERKLIHLQGEGKPPFFQLVFNFLNIGIFSPFSICMFDSSSDVSQSLQNHRKVHSSPTELDHQQE